MSLDAIGTFNLGDRTVKRIGYGAMQLAGPHVFGPPKDRAAAVALLRQAIELGIDHIDTSDYYGPHITNQIIREALHPYSQDLTIVTKIGARRDEKGNWLPAASRDDLTAAVHDNLRNLGLDVLDVVNFRVMLNIMDRGEGSIEEPLTALAELQHQGLLRHIGISNVTQTQLEEARQIVKFVCVQNLYNVARREDDPMIDELAREGVAFVPFFPLGGFTPVQSETLSQIAEALDATPLQVAQAWLLRRSPNIILIPGTSSLAHLRQNIAVADLVLSDDCFVKLDAIEAASPAAQT